MVKRFLKRVMEKNPYWEIFDWHPMNLAFKKNGHSRRHCISCGNVLQSGDIC